MKVLELFIFLDSGVINYWSCGMTNRMADNLRARALQAQVHLSIVKFQVAKNTALSEVLARLQLCDDVAPVQILHFIINKYILEQAT